MQRFGRPPSYSDDEALSDATLAETSGEVDMVSSEVSLLGARLDEHHLPDTNGRMAVCRRCGSQTESPLGHQHVPSDRRLARSEEWLDAQKQKRRIDDARESLKR